jgi:flavin reductase (DIM6/NTAB) family NADH-FMN oxidoreductase RutF
VKIRRRPSTLVVPVPAALITVAAPDGPGNIVTLAWVGTVCSAPPMLSISIRPSRYSHELLSQTNEFVVNLPRAEQVELVDLCGLVSGREVDKFALTGFHPLPAELVDAPLIDECPVNLECVTRHRLSLGVHDLFIGEVVATHVDEDVLDSRGRLDKSRLDPLAYVDGEYWNLGKRVGSHGFTKPAFEDKRRGTGRDKE